MSLEVAMLMIAVSVLPGGPPGVQLPPVCQDPPAALFQVNWADADPAKSPTAARVSAPRTNSRFRPGREEVVMERFPGVHLGPAEEFGAERNQTPFPTSNQRKK